MLDLTKYSTIEEFKKDCLKDLNLTNKISEDLFDIVAAKIATSENHFESIYEHMEAISRIVKEKSK